MQRRDFIHAVAGGGSLFSVSSQTEIEAKKLTSQEMLYRTLGKTGVQVSVIGVGGHHIGIPKDPHAGMRIIRTALDSGINFMDNSWDYHDGESERRMGQALKHGYREKAFLMTKIDGRTKKTAADQLNESLKRLNVDHIDLIQHHEVIRLEDPDRIVAAEDAHEALVAAQKAGKVRFIGFTGHKDPTVHLRLLDIAKAKGISFDSVQMPINVLDAHFRSFTQHVVPRLVAEGIGIIGMKSMASGGIVKEGVATPTECLRFALSLPTSTVVVGMDEILFLHEALKLIKTYQPMSKPETAALLGRTEKVALAGKIEAFKTHVKFDATSKNPHWLG